MLNNLETCRECLRLRVGVAYTDLIQKNVTMGTRNHLTVISRLTVEREE